jgi:hypothetical protein
MDTSTKNVERTEDLKVWFGWGGGGGDDQFLNIFVRRVLAPKMNEIRRLHLCQCPSVIFQIRLISSGIWKF